MRIIQKKIFYSIATCFLESRSESRSTDAIEFADQWSSDQPIASISSLSLKMKSSQKFDSKIEEKKCPEIRTKNRKPIFRLPKPQSKDFRADSINKRGFDLELLVGSRTSLEIKLD